MSGVDAFYVVRDGEVMVCDEEDFEKWLQKRPEGAFLVTPVIGVEVITTFNGILSTNHGRTHSSTPFESWVKDHSVYGVLGASRWERARHQHQRMIDNVIQRWFCTWQPSDNIPAPGPLSAGTRITDVARASGCLLASPAATAARSSIASGGGDGRSSRWRLLNALRGLGSASWFEINKMLETTPEKCLSAMSAAWTDSLLIRIESSDQWKPPSFSLSDAGKDRLQLGDFSITSSTEDDRWEPGWESWMEHACPVCGGFLDKTGGGNLVCVADACQPGQRFDDRHYEGILKDGALVEATARLGELEYFVSYAENRHEKRKAGQVLRAASGISSDERIRNYVRNAFG
ncbi:MAG: hypothetical protein WDO69_32600 [Pseudomonadota bacterium]